MDYSGLTDVSFANLLEISEKQIRLIKKGHAEFSIDNINKACDFFRKSLASLNNKGIEIDRMFRDKLIAAHKGNAEYMTILEGRPSITYAINIELMENDMFITDGLDVSQIGMLFQKRGWVYPSAYISTAMNRSKDRIQSISHPSKKGKYLYSKK